MMKRSELMSGIESSFYSGSHEKLLVLVGYSDISGYTKSERAIIYCLCARSFLALWQQAKIFDLSLTGADEFRYAELATECVNQEGAVADYCRAWALRILVMYACGDKKDAYTCLAEKSSRYRNNSQLALAWATILIWRGDFSEAIYMAKIAQSFAMREGDVSCHARALYCRAIAYQRQGDAKSAKEYFLRAKKFLEENFPKPKNQTPEIKRLLDKIQNVM